MTAELSPNFSKVKHYENNLHFRQKIMTTICCQILKSSIIELSGKNYPKSYGRGPVAKYEQNLSLWKWLKILLKIITADLLPNMSKRSTIVDGTHKISPKSHDHGCVTKSEQKQPLLCWLKFGQIVMTADLSQNLIKVNHCKNNLKFHQKIMTTIHRQILRENSTFMELTQNKMAKKLWPCTCRQIWG